MILSIKKQETYVIIDCKQHNIYIKGKEQKCLQIHIANSNSPEMIF